MENTAAEKKDEKKKVNWNFDSNTGIMSASGIKAEKESQFSFKLERFKDGETHEESIKITCFRKKKEEKTGNLIDEENGVIFTSIVDLESDIKQFRKFGVVIGTTYFRDLCNQIELCYFDIRENPITLDNKDKRLDGLITQVKEYVIGEKDLITDEFCYVPVTMFNGLADDCGYSNYEMQTLRKQLANDKFIHVVSGRFAILKRIKDKPERFVAFHREKVGVEVPVKQTKKSKEKSDTDEK